MKSEKKMNLERLDAFGANTKEGLARCMNDEPLYLRLVAMTLEDGNFEKLRSAMEAGDANGAFNAAHALKGAAGNVALTPLYEPLCELTELLRGKSSPVEGGEELLEEILVQREKALSL